MWRIHNLGQNRKEPDSKERFVLPAALKELSQICRCEIAFARNILAPVSSKLVWQVVPARISFRELLKNDEDAPIALLKVL